VGAESRLTSTKTDIEQQAVDHQRGHLKTFFDAADNELGSKLNASRVALEQSRIAVDALPQMIAQAKAKNALSELQSNDMLIAGFMHSMQIGDKGASIQYAQNVANSGALAALKGAQIGDIGHAPDPKYPNDPKRKLTVINDTNGNPLIVLSPEQMKAAFNRTNPADYKILGNGGSLAKVQGGEVEIVANNPRDYKPADRIAQDAATQKNEDMRMSRGKSVIADYFKANSLGGLDPTSQPNYRKSVARMGELVRSGMAPEKAANQALEEIERQRKLDEVAGGAAGASAATGKDFSKWWGGQ
jgi:hypothetical protein